MRQFIIDDKGCVAIGTWGLKGSKSVGYIPNDALPACRAIYKAAKAIGIKVRMGLTIGRVYCGRIGSLKRHEFAVLGPSVNLSARLMCSALNEGLLVDQSIVDKGLGEDVRALEPIRAKGYSELVNIYSPSLSRARPKSADRFRRLLVRDTNVIASAAWLASIDKKSWRSSLLERQATFEAIGGLVEEGVQGACSASFSRRCVTLEGESGIGKTVLAREVMETIKAREWPMHITTVCAEAKESSQAIPFSSFTLIFQEGLEKYFCGHWWRTIPPWGLFCPLP